jgi:RHH-type proline utilization regulon transcriptional repressor/proline dehydrogenase/delta 1-pyrroline-5-carboxylate dehydrogenase
MNTARHSGDPRLLGPADAKVDFGAYGPEFCDRVARLAEQLLETALAQQTQLERREAAKLGRLMNDPVGKAFTFAMVDQVFRSRDTKVAARRWRGLLRKFGVPGFMPVTDRILMRVGAWASHVMPGWVMKGVAKRMRSDSSRVILAGEKDPLHRYLLKRESDGFRVNLNHLGEAVLGEGEAANRSSAVLNYLADPAVKYVSIKVSAIFSQINLIAWEDTLREIKSRIRILYQAAAKVGKFVNLDMEEYRDLGITEAAFRQLLDEVEFQSFSAGIVLQAYLPDSYAIQQELTQWARNRVASGGAPIKIRLVKGANLAMEAVEAELHGWEPAPYPTKADTDANFRRMLEYGCRPENACAVRLGVASHNLFDVALALVLRDLNGVNQQVEIEMLEGMANHQARAVRDKAGGLLLYAPAVQQNDFMSAMAYLVRRLDENTAPENFLREMFAMRPGSPEWNQQKDRFVRGWNERTTVSAKSRRDRKDCHPVAHTPDETQVDPFDPFQNVPDSDWTQQSIRSELRKSLDCWNPETLPALPELDVMLRTAVAGQLDWEARSAENRAVIVNRAANLMREQRYRAIAALCFDGKKAIVEADGEVSEAIDFARYYARTAPWSANLPLDREATDDRENREQANALGVVAVVSPWNFPYAIPAGGILAALMAGNSVILKPARATLQIAWLLVRQLWEAGVPREVLHFYPCDNEQGEALLTDNRIACAILTGSYETARKFQSWRPSLPLLAETSGKNSLVITAQADREQAIKDLVRSAFGHSGQKCSAASLAILEAEVYDDRDFFRQLRDSASSLFVGPATDPRSIVTPLVIAPGSNLLRALTTLDAGEEWLLKPQPIAGDPCLWTPGIKWGVRPDSWFHRTECFGPVLGLMRADSLAQATQFQNATDFGLTAGLHSLDSNEIAYWREHAQAGNLYINRPITGAIVQRQPFGGWKRSCIGPGAKAGGPNYVRSLCQFQDVKDKNVEVDYAAAWTTHFSREHDPSALRSESNVFRYRPCRGVILRLNARDQQSISRATIAARITNVPLSISIREEEDDAMFIARLAELTRSAEFFRTIDVPNDKVLRAVNEVGLNWINAPLLAAGRIELTRWLREQSVSETRHRYGQLSDPAVVPRSPFYVTAAPRV